VFGFRDFEYENFGIRGYLDKFIKINDDNCHELFFEFAKGCYIGNIKSLEEIINPKFFENFLDATLESYATNMQLSMSLSHASILAIVWFNYYKEGNYQEVNKRWEKLIDTWFRVRIISEDISKQLYELEKMIDVQKYYIQIQPESKMKYEALDYAEKREEFYSIFNKYRTCKEEITTIEEIYFPPLPIGMTDREWTEFEKQFAKNYHKLKRDYNLTKEKMDDIAYMYISDYHILTIQQKLDLEKLIKML
jgi:hypothetical protein